MVSNSYHGGAAKSLSRHSRTVAGLALATCACIAAWRLTARRTDVAVQQQSASNAATDSVASVMQAAVLDEDIAFYEERAATDPYSAGDYARLALLFLERGRMRGDPDDALRAERAARTSLAARTMHNDGAAVLLAGSLLEQHRFADAREVARYLVARDSESVTHRALLAEIELELGAYAAADTIFWSLQPHWRELVVAPRVARWHEIHGRLEDARLALRTLARDAVADSYVPRSQVAWVHYRLGEFEMRYGRAEPARSALEAGFRLAPGDHRLLATMAQLEAAHGNWPAAIALADRSIAVIPDPAVLGLLSDAYSALGDSDQSNQYARAAAALSLRVTGTIHRSWSLLWLDRGEHLDDVLARARKESAARRDVYGDDVLAWALHAVGRDTEARVAIGRALAQGTRDPGMLFHAGMIERALGNGEEARRYLEAAVTMNPQFHPTQGSVARAVIDSLKAVVGAP